MKVYFEPTGYSEYLIALNVYVKPQKNGSGYHYEIDGTKSLFYWVNPDNARVFDSAELPSKLWYSIQHGLATVYIAKGKEKSWELSDLIYEPVTEKQTDAYALLQTKTDSVKSLEDVNQLFPLLKQTSRIPHELVLKVFSLYGEKPTPVINGELGIASMCDSFKFSEILKGLGFKYTDVDNH